MLRNFIWYFLSLNGRINRQEFWLGFVLVGAVVLILRWNLDSLFWDVHRPVGHSRYSGDLALDLTLPKAHVAALMLWPVLAIAVKRLHDFNLSGWWFAAPLILLPIGAVVPPWDVMAWVVLLGIGLIPGIDGGNRYGADPAQGRRS